MFDRLSFGWYESIFSSYLADKVSVTRFKSHLSLIALLAGEGRDFYGLVN
jgi:hypothetical protein